MNKISCALIIGCALFCLFVIPNRVDASVCNFTPGIQSEEFEKCLNEQRRQDQAERDQLKIEEEFVKKMYDSKLDHFYKVDVIEKQLDASNKSNFNYLKYRLSSADCVESVKIPADPTTLDASIFLDLVENKDRCVMYLLNYTKSVVNQSVQPTKTNDQVCSDKYGKNWKQVDTEDSTGSLICGCEEGYINKNGQCITYDQSCSMTYPNTSFLKIDADDNKRVCDCNDGYVWNRQGTGCVAGPVIQVKTNDQVCDETYAHSKGVLDKKGILTCDCQNGYIWNMQQTGCISNQLPLSTRTLRTGTRGADVTRLQDFLRTDGYVISKTEIKRGRFGTSTKRALKKYQKKIGIQSTGSLVGSGN